MRELVAGRIKGLGINDAGVQATHTEPSGKRVVNPYYLRWSGMLGRVTTHGSEVCDDWLYLSKFIRDIQILEERHGISVYDGRKCCLDKDLKYVGNKLYSLDTCLLVPNIVNCLFQDSSTIRGDLPLGVTFRGDLKTDNPLKYRAQISEPFTHKQIRKSFETPEEAHRYWQLVKLEMILSVYQLQDPFVKEALDKRIALLQEDILLGRETKSLLRRDFDKTNTKTS